MKPTRELDGRLTGGPKYRERVAAVEAALVPTTTRTRLIITHGEISEVDVPVASKGGYFAFYMRGTGPFYTNREQRRRSSMATGAQRRKLMLKTTIRHQKEAPTRARNNA